MKMGESDPRGSLLASLRNKQGGPCSDYDQPLAVKRYLVARSRISLKNGPGFNTGGSVVYSGTQLFVFTAGDTGARAHLRDSIENPVELDTALATFPPAVQDQIKGVYQEERGLFAWGAIPGPQNTPRWKQMQRGDWILCVYDSVYHYAARVKEKYENEKFANEVWGKDSEGRTWSLMYFLSRPLKIQVSVHPLAAYLNAGYFGFTRIGDEKLEQIGKEFGSIDAFMQAKLLTPSPIPYFLIRSNENSPYQDELGTRYHFSETVPNSKKIMGGGYVVADRKTANGTRIVGHGMLGLAEEIDTKRTSGPKEFHARFASWTPFDTLREIPERVQGELQRLPGYNVQHAIRPITEAIYKMLTTTSSALIETNLASVVSSFSTHLTQSYVRFGEDQLAIIRAFVASLAAKPLVILTGLSGSGKTQVAIRFGEWLGEGRMHVAAVRPDWTGAEALFGYEDALKPTKDGAAAWTVPDPLAFLLRAGADSDHPYLLVLDEMNLAHVERYFADVLSGMESEQPCLPNLNRGTDGYWRRSQNEPERIPFPRNVFVIGTVNVDETTYMFSPKVLDRANTFEFRVKSSDLGGDYHKPLPCEPGELSLVRGFLEISRDHSWHLRTPYSHQVDLEKRLRLLHQLLARHGYEFGHRILYEAVRFAALYEQAGEASLNAVLDRVVIQKVLPRLHGSRRRLELPLLSLALHCFTLSENLPADSEALKFITEDKNPQDAALPVSFDKLQRMIRSLRANQFTSFTE